MPTKPQTRRAVRKPGGWWEVFSVVEPGFVPFLGLYLEALGLRLGSRVALPEQESLMSMTTQDRIVEPVQGWPRFEQHRWGEDQELNGMIEDWFDAGDELQHVDTLVHDLKIDEPDRWERAFHWVRSLLVAT